MGPTSTLSGSLPTGASAGEAIGGLIDMAPPAVEAAPRQDGNGRERKKHFLDGIKKSRGAGEAEASEGAEVSEMAELAAVA